MKIKYQNQEKDQHVYCTFWKYDIIVHALKLSWELREKGIFPVYHSHHDDIPFFLTSSFPFNFLLLWFLFIFNARYYLHANRVLWHQIKPFFIDWRYIYAMKPQFILLFFFNEHQNAKEHCVSKVNVGNTIHTYHERKIKCLKSLNQILSFNKYRFVW